MTANSASEIRIAGTGRLLVAPTGSVLPIDVATPWDAAWNELGFTTSDGVTFSKKDKLDPVDTWQAISPVRFLYADRDLTVKFTLLQFNATTLPLFMGGGAVTTTTGISTYDIADAPQTDERALGLEFNDGGTITYRFVIPRGHVTASDDIKLGRKGAAQLGITFTAMNNDSNPLASFIMNDPAYSAA